MLVAERRMQFCAGPETYLFRACRDHVVDLARGRVSCFLPLVGEDIAITVVDDGEETGCYFCQEGGQ